MCFHVFEEQVVRFPFPLNSSKHFFFSKFTTFQFLLETEWITSGHVWQASHALHSSVLHQTHRQTGNTADTSTEFHSCISLLLWYQRRKESYLNLTFFSHQKSRKRKQPVDDQQSKEMDGWESFVRWQDHPRMWGQPLQQHYRQPAARDGITHRGCQDEEVAEFLGQSPFVRCRAQREDSPDPIHPRGLPQQTPELLGPRRPHSSHCLLRHKGQQTYCLIAKAINQLVANIWSCHFYYFVFNF